jgi:hypothetical protein
VVRKAPSGIVKIGGRSRRWTRIESAVVRYTSRQDGEDFYQAQGDPEHPWFREWWSALLPVARVISSLPTCGAFSYAAFVGSSRYFSRLHPLAASPMRCTFFRAVKDGDV